MNFDRGLISTDPLQFIDDEPYEDKLRAARELSGRGDAAVYGRASIHGHPVVLFVLDFGFLGGSMGVVVGEKLARAAELARKEKRALVTVVASGGARMQEGLLSLLQMAKTASSVQEVKDAGVPFISVLTHPTTGGVFASFSSLGDVIYAEPGALVGFAGPRVAEQFLGRPLPPGSHTAEFQLKHGFVDSIVPRFHLRSAIGITLNTLGSNLDAGKRDRRASVRSNRSIRGKQSKRRAIPNVRRPCTTSPHASTSGSNSMVTGVGWMTAPLLPGSAKSADRR